jgi:hypothetical protein
MTIEMPKRNEWINPKMTLDFAREGYFHGCLILQLNFTGALCPSEEVMLDVIQAVLSVEDRLPLRKTIRLAGLVNPADTRMGLFIRSLRDYDFTVQAQIKEMPIEDWTSGVWLIYQTPARILPFRADEIWYSPAVDRETDVIPDFERIPTTSARSTPRAMYFYLDRKFSVSASMKFFAESKYNWALL